MENTFCQFIEADLRISPVIFGRCAELNEEEKQKEEQCLSRSTADSTTGEEHQHRGTMAQFFSPTVAGLLGPINETLPVTVSRDMNFIFLIAAYGLHAMSMKGYPSQMLPAKAVYLPSPAPHSGSKRNSDRDKDGDGADDGDSAEDVPDGPDQ